MIFDLDGTLVDSRLDFDKMRADIGIPSGQPVLEFVESLPPGPRKDEAWRILERHEFQGAHDATVIPGILHLLEKLHARGIKRGILTRNIAGPTRIVIDKFFGTHFCQVITRDDAPPKPDPGGLLKICKAWGIAPEEAIFVGDYAFDVYAGKNAGMPTILYLGGEEGRPAYADDASHVIQCFETLNAEFEDVVERALGFTLDV